jgi:ferredoxin
MKRNPSQGDAACPFRTWRNPVVEDSFEVRLRRSGRTVIIPQGQTILRTLLDAGVDADFSCSMGGCGTCETRVVEGTPDHRDNYLTDEEKATNKVIMICCSRSKSPYLVLDL